GLVNRTVPAAELMETAFEYARRIAANAPLAVQAAKELAVRSRDMDVATGLRVEQLVNLLLAATEDAAEGPAASAEKRPPRSKGRSRCGRPVRCRSPASWWSSWGRSTTSPTRPS